MSDSHPGLGDRGDGDRGQHASAGHLAEHLGARAPERERDDVGSGIQHQVDLLLPVVVLPSGLAELSAETSSLGFQGATVGIERSRFRLVRLDDEQVHPEWRRRGRSHGIHLGSHRIRGLVAGSQEAEATGPGHRGSQGGGGRTTRHGRPHDGQRQVAHVEHTRHATDWRATFVLRSRVARRADERAGWSLPTPRPSRRAGGLSRGWRRRFSQATSSDIELIAAEVSGSLAYTVHREITSTVVEKTMTLPCSRRHEQALEATVLDEPDGLAPATVTGVTDDRSQIEEIVRTFFAAFSSGPDLEARLEGLRAVLLPEALVVRTCGVPASYDVDGFIDPRRELLTSGRVDRVPRVGAGRHHRGVRRPRPPLVHLRQGVGGGR